MSTLKSRIFRTIAVLSCAAFCGVLIAGCNGDEATTGNSTGTTTTKAPGDKPGGMAPGSAAPTSSGS